MLNSKIKYLPDPILDLREIREKKLADDILDQRVLNKKFIVSIKLTYQKNFDFMIKAFKQIVKDYPKLNLLILGEGEERNKLEKLVKKLNLENKIFFDWL